MSSVNSPASALACARVCVCVCASNGTLLKCQHSLSHSRLLVSRWIPASLPCLSAAERLDFVTSFSICVAVSGSYSLLYPHTQLSEEDIVGVLIVDNLRGQQLCYAMQISMAVQLWCD